MSARHEADMVMKLCESCGDEIIRNKNTSDAAWERQKNCGEECTHLARNVGEKSKVVLAKRFKEVLAGKWGAA